MMLDKSKTDLEGRIQEEEQPAVSEEKSSRTIVISFYDAVFRDFFQLAFDEDTGRAFAYRGQNYQEKRWAPLIDGLKVIGSIERKGEADPHYFGTMFGDLPMPDEKSFSRRVEVGKYVVFEGKGHRLIADLPDNCSHKAGADICNDALSAKMRGLYMEYRNRVTAEDRVYSPYVVKKITAMGDFWKLNEAIPIYRQ